MELKERVDYYLAHPEERREIADRAYVWAHREHTYELRLREMFGVPGLAAEGNSVSVGPVPIQQV